MARPDLDAWLPEPRVRTHHRLPAAAAPDALWRAAGGVRLSETRTLGRVVRWRIPGTAASTTFAELLRSYPFALLAEGDGYSISGLCGRIWTLRRDYPELSSPEEFRAWSEPGTVRVLFAHWVEPNGAGGAALVSEARVEPVDGAAALRLRALWSVVGRFEPFIGSEPLPAAARRAERGGGRQAPARTRTRDLGR